MNKWILILMMLLLIPLANALGECQDIQSFNDNCTVITPVIDCSTYDLYNETNDLVIDDGVMSQIGSIGVYNFTFLANDTGVHIIHLCSNHVSTIYVGVTDQDYIELINSTLVNKIEGTNTSLHDDLRNINSSLYNRINQINSSIIIWGDRNWTTASSISINESLIADYVWNETSRTITGGNLTSTTSVNVTEIVEGIFDYNLTGEGYTAVDNGLFGNFIKLILDVVQWIERLI